jgi:hypothetical protein
VVFFAEDSVHGTLAVEAGIHAGLGDGLVAEAEEMDEVPKAGLVQIAIEVHMESRGEEPGQGVGTDIEVLCHGGQGYFAGVIPGNVLDGPVDQVVASHGILLHQVEHGKYPAQNDLEIGIHEDIMVDLAVVEIFQADQGLDDVVGNPLLWNDRILSCIALERIAEGRAVVGRRMDEEGVAFLTGHILIMVDDLRKNQGQIACLHMEEIGSASDFHASTPKIDQLHGFVQMRRYMLNRFYIDFKIGFVLIDGIHREHLLTYFNSIFQSNLFFFVDFDFANSL